MIDRLITSLNYTESIHQSFNYTKAHEGESQRLYNEGIIHGMKNAMFSAMHHLESLVNQQVYAKLISELNHKEDRHNIDVKENNFESIYDEINREGQLEGYRHMVDVVKGFIHNEVYTASHVLSLTVR